MVINYESGNSGSRFRNRTKEKTTAGMKKSNTNGMPGKIPLINLMLHRQSSQKNECYYNIA